MAQAFPNLTGKQIVEILFGSADDLGAAGVDKIYGHGALEHRSRVPADGRRRAMADSQTPVSLADNGDMPAAAGDAVTTKSLGAVILDGYSRAYVLNLARTLHVAQPDTRWRARCRTTSSVGGASAGPISIAMTVRERRDLPYGFEAGAGSASGPKTSASRSSWPDRPWPGSTGRRRSRSASPRAQSRCSGG